MHRPGANRSKNEHNKSPSYAPTLQCHEGQRAATHSTSSGREGAGKQCNAELGKVLIVVLAWRQYARKYMLDIFQNAR